MALSLLAGENPPPKKIFLSNNILPSRIVLSKKDKKGRLFISRGGRMFIYSVRASTVKFFILIGVTLALLVTLIGLGTQDAVYASVGNITVNYGGMRTNEDRVNFIESFGVLVKDEPKIEESFSAPEALDRAVAGYNEIQKAQGLDLSKYKGKRVTHYSYEVENYDYDGPVYVNLLIYKNRIIGCDISSADGKGFVLPLVGLDTSRLKS